MLQAKNLAVELLRRLQIVHRNRPVYDGIEFKFVHRSTPFDSPLSHPAQPVHWTEEIDREQRRIRLLISTSALTIPSPYICDARSGGHMANRTITIGMRDYDHCRALANGRVKVEGADLKFVNISPPSQIFLRMLHDEEFDASEMSLSNFMIAVGKDDRRFVAIPVFPSRVFRHSYIWINTKAGIAKPADLKGKKVGIADYSMTALLFVRGLLQHEYGVTPRRYPLVSPPCRACRHRDSGRYTHRQHRQRSDPRRPARGRRARCRRRDFAAARVSPGFAFGCAAVSRLPRRRSGLLPADEDLSDHAHDGDAPGDLRTRPDVGSPLVARLSNRQGARLRRL